jgi:hypothetical protein
VLSPPLSTFATMDELLLASALWSFNTSIVF